jgi:uncharacterized RmlC-like cupin family protein
MNTTNRRFHLFWIALVSILVLVPSNTSLAQENPPPAPIDLPCVNDVSAQVLGMTPVNDGAQNLVLARVILAPGGRIEAHTHPGTVVATVESGTFGFTHLGDGEMSVNRAATADSEATSEVLPHGEEVTLTPGDWFVETGMVHTGVNLDDGPTTVVLTGLIEPGQGLTICADNATPAA